MKARTNGEIYIGVVGPVRTGKSTFIKRFMNLMVLPNIEDENDRNRANDELPQSSSGKTIMTTEPKFVPNEAVSIKTEEGIELNEMCIRDSSRSASVGNIKRTNIIGKVGIKYWPW